MHKNQNGNVLFLILIAVALFATLSYAITNSTRTNLTSVNDDEWDSYATELINYVAQARLGLSRMTLGENIQWWQLDYYPYSTTWTNPNCTTPSCKLHHINGGGMPSTFQRPPRWLKPGATGWAGISYVLTSVENIGSSAPDVVMIIEKMDGRFCKVLNRRLGITGFPIWNESPSTSLYAVGSIALDTPPTATGRLGEEPTATAIIGKHMGCGCYTADCSNAYDYRFFAVLIEL